MTDGLNTAAKSTTRMNGVAALGAISKYRTDQVVITTMSTIHDWSLVSARKDLDVDIIRPMGKCGSLGLGLAPARPDLQFRVVDGDGSLLMNLGSLITMAAMAPRNLVYMVYQTVLGQ